MERRKPDRPHYYHTVKASKKDDHNALAHYLDDLWCALSFGTDQAEHDAMLRNAKRNRNRLRVIALFGHPEHKYAARDVLRLVSKNGFWHRAGKKLRDTLLGK